MSHGSSLAGFCTVEHRRHGTHRTPVHLGGPQPRSRVRPVNGRPEDAFRRPLGPVTLDMNS